MELKDVVSIAGIGGLHQVVGRNKNGLIVETLDATKKRFATNIRQRISVLQDISIFTEEGEAKLSSVIKTIKEKEDGGLKVPDSKSDNDELKAFMSAVLPDYDKERVYVSDIKKLAVWYHVLKPTLDFASLDKEEEGESSEISAENTEKNTKKPVEKAAPKNVKTPTPRVNAGAKSKTTTPRKMGS